MAQSPADADSSQQQPAGTFVPSTTDSAAVDDVVANHPPLDEEEPEIIVEPETPELNFRDRSIFVNEATMLIYRFKSEVEPELELPASTENLAFLNVSFEKLKKSQGFNYAAYVYIVPRTTGLITLPSLPFTVGEVDCKSAITQFTAGQIKQDSSMRLTYTPAKTQVYVGEPVKVDVHWRSPYSMSALRQLNVTPAFFTNPNITSVVPRPQFPEEQQIGLPFGGRRVIAHNTSNENDPLGDVRFTIYLSFDKVGSYQLEPTRLQVQRLLGKVSHYRRYAAYFDNSFFEPAENNQLFERLYVDSNTMDFEVLPLPADDSAPVFSGLFEPVDIELSLNPHETQVGQLMEATVKVKSEVDPQFLTIPPLNTQKSLRNRFWTNENQARLWQPDGRQFTMRMRPLSADLNTLPPLQFKTFDPAVGEYKTYTTEAIPIKITPDGDERFFDISKLPNTTISIESNAAGVWHNQPNKPMDNLVNTIVNSLASQFWIWLIIGPLGYFIIGPILRRKYLLATNESFRLRYEAWMKLRKQPTNEQAFEDYLATALDMAPGSLTTKDLTTELQKNGASEDLIANVNDYFKQRNASQFAPSKPASDHAPLVQLATSIQKAMNRSLLAILGFALISLASVVDVQADTFTDAETRFANALTSTDFTADSQFATAALLFEKAAEEDHNPGIAYYNAGNAWTKAGEIGRAIAAYKQALPYRLHDAKLRESLDAVRGLRKDKELQNLDPAWWQWPLQWDLAALIIAWLVFWLLITLRMRFRNQKLNFTAYAVGVITLLLAIASVTKFSQQSEQGVIILDEVQGLKGPAASYSPAFHGALHNGLEFKVVKTENDWLYIQLADKRNCWIPASSCSVF